LGAAVAGTATPNEIMIEVKRLSRFSIGLLRMVAPPSCTGGQWVYPNKFGNQVLSPGNKTISPNTANSVSNMGAMALASVNNGILVMAETTNSTPPTGGVIIPIVRLRMTTMAKCRGSMPAVCATGARIGTRMMTAGSVSRNNPQSNRNTDTAINRPSGGKSRLTMAWLTDCGICKTVSM